MQMIENLAAQAKERLAGAIARTQKLNIDLAIDAPRRRSDDEDAIAHVDGFIAVVGHEKHGGTAIFPEPEHFVLHPHAREGVERAERFIEQKHFGVIDQCACESNALGHAPGKMMWIRIAKRF